MQLHLPQWDGLRTGADVLVTGMRAVSETLIETVRHATVIIWKGGHKYIVVIVKITVVVVEEVWLKKWFGSLLSSLGVGGVGDEGNPKA